MKNPLIYIKNYMYIIYLYICHGSNLNIGKIQSFEKLRFVLKNKGKANIGSFNQNRGILFLGIFGGHLYIGNHCFFNINCSITCIDKIEIGNNCKFGNNLVIVDHDHNFQTDEPEFISSPIKFGDNVWVGANVTILRGTEIGDNCVVAAGTTLKGKYPDNSIIKNISNIEIREIR